MQRAAVGAHPFRWERRRLAGADVPVFGEVPRRPRAPRFWGVVDAEPALKAGVRAGQRLAPEVTLEARVVGDVRAVTAASVREHAAAALDVFGPVWRDAGIEELVRGPFADALLRHAGEHHAVGGLIGAVVIMRVDVHEIVAGPGVVAAEVQKARATAPG